jgi:hypothetical protein
VNRWIQLFRLQTSGITIGMMVLTRWVAAGVDLVDTIILILAGLAHHAGFFGLNEWCDRVHDEGNPHKTNPITMGTIPARTALELSTVLISASLALLLVWAGFGPWSILLLASYVYAGAYDVWSKKVTWSGWILAGWVATLSLWIISLSGFPLRALWMPLVWFFMLYLQTLEGDLKDMDHEENLATGDRDKVIEFMGLAQLAWGMSFAPLAETGSWTVLMVMFTGLVASFFFLTMVEVCSNRQSMLRAMGLHNIVEYGTIVFVCHLWVEIWLLALVFIAPVVIYGAMNRLGYGSAAAPGI